jgi:hypothetical protein
MCLTGSFLAAYFDLVLQKVFACMGCAGFVNNTVIKIYFAVIEFFIYSRVVVVFASIVA